MYVPTRMLDRQKDRGWWVGKKKRERDSNRFFFSDISPYEGADEVRDKAIPRMLESSSEAVEERRIYKVDAKTSSNSCLMTE